MTVSKCDGKEHPKGSQPQDCQNKPNDETENKPTDETEKELVPTANSFLLTKQLVRPSKKTQTQKNPKQMISYGGKDITNDKFFEEPKDKEKQRNSCKRKACENNTNAVKQTPQNKKLKSCENNNKNNKTPSQKS